MSEVRLPIQGAVRYFDTVGQSHHIVEPGHAGYMDALMVADEYWSPDRKEWVKISLKGTTTGRMSSKQPPRFEEIPRA